jgi:hypothetical protein
MIASTDGAPTRRASTPAGRRLGRAVTPILAATIAAVVVLSGCSGSGATTSATRAPVASSSAAPAVAEAGTGITAAGSTATAQSVDAATAADVAAPPGGSSGSTALASTASGVYSQSGGTAEKGDLSVSSSFADQSGVLVTDAGTLALTNVTVTTSGDTSSDENSSFAGLNAGILATSGSTITVVGGKISTTGSGANGAFASGTGSSVALSDVTITATGDGGHGVMATQGGSVTLTKVDMDTTGAHGAPLATDRGGGTVTATGGTITASGTDSPGIYSTGTITVADATITATGAEAAVIEGANTIDLTDTALTTTKADKWGVMIYQSMSGDASGTEGTFTMSSGSLVDSGAGSPLFYVTNSTGIITLADVDVSTTSGILVRAAAGSWGTAGANGGTAVLTADAEILAGDVEADAISSLSISLGNGTTLTGAIDAGNTAARADLALDATSAWTVTADSYLTILSDDAGISGSTVTNIVGNGHTVYYDPSANETLGGRTYTLVGGGTLMPQA